MQLLGVNLSSTLSWSIRASKYSPFSILAVQSSKSKPSSFMGMLNKWGIIELIYMLAVYYGYGGSEVSFILRLSLTLYCTFENNENVTISLMGLFGLNRRYIVDLLSSLDSFISILSFNQDFIKLSILGSGWWTSILLGLSPCCLKNWGTSIISTLMHSLRVLHLISSSK